MTSDKDTSGMSEHEKKNEGGRESGHVHDPSQAQQASKNQGLADRKTRDAKQTQHTPGQQQGGNTDSQTESHSQPGKSPTHTSQEHGKERQPERKSA